GAVVLHLHLAVAQATDDAAQALEVGALGVRGFHGRAAGELDREVQAAGDQEEHGREEREGRDDVEHQRVPHERDVAPDTEEFHERFLRIWTFQRAAPGVLAASAVSSSAGMPGLPPPFQTCPISTDLSFFWRPYQRLTRPREKNTAENIEVRMPRQCTMAKPLMAPEPNSSSDRPAISVVMLESR